MLSKKSASAKSLKMTPLFMMTDQHKCQNHLIFQFLTFSDHLITSSLIVICSEFGFDGYIITIDICCTCFVGLLFAPARPNHPVLNFGMYKHIQPM